MKRKKMIILSGATATGKTQWALELGGKFPLEIVNFDSLLFYRELNIGTCKPSEKQMGEIPHHLINVKSAKNPINAPQFASLARDTINSLHRRNLTPLLVGGSGFYLNTLLNGSNDNLPPSEETLEQSRQLFEESGIAPFRDILKKHDPPNFHKLHPNDHYRIRRAVEYYWSTKEPFSSAPNPKPPPWELHHLYLHIEKFQHWDMIRARSEKIVKNGLLDEVSKLLSKNFTGQERPLRSVGYKEAQEYLDHKISTREELVDKITISTRQLAKAQKTFFAHMEPKEVFSPFEQREKLFKNLHPLF